MPAKLIIRVYPDDRVHVKVEGFAGTDESKPNGEKLCEKVTRRLERDLGTVEHREYEAAPEQAMQQLSDEEIKLGHEGSLT